MCIWFRFINNIILFYSIRYIKIFNEIFCNIKNFLNINTNSFFINFLVLFFIIFFTNFYRLYSYIFSLRSIPLFTFLFGFFFWFIFFFINFNSNYKLLLSHLVPAGCPIYLISFIVFIELIRLFIRPLTLRVRLAANITAGHILIIIRRKSFLGRGLLIILELIVRGIQAFVFVLLLTLYYNESN